MRKEEYFYMRGRKKLSPFSVSNWIHSNIRSVEFQGNEFFLLIEVNMFISFQVRISMVEREKDFL